eukprot:CAMPEP_0202907190 /NCGR_PEP_ID=MMETSP1392-20130828/41664_1 /ASSEMBLY_ACC=CAM_ASM_000868 /TAXON_ID=225041 /ORGANISM="Chlamydomonas chlamydogama, Strain SAG 11-48b" /LENGTH=62 /DNA_ID=CAMNT_0049595987 /DNA_START=63 /DNA_END=251 /DNA_ORIENTATION=-
MRAWCSRGSLAVPAYSLACAGMRMVPLPSSQKSSSSSTTPTPGRPPGPSFCCRAASRAADRA